MHVTQMTATDGSGVDGVPLLIITIPPRGVLILV